MVCFLIARVLTGYSQDDVHEMRHFASIETTSHRATDRLLLALHAKHRGQGRRVLFAS